MYAPELGAPSAREQPSRIASLWARLRAFSPYLLLATGVAVLILGIWLSVDARIKAEEENVRVRALDRAQSAAKSFEQYALRTLKAADNLTRMAIVSLSHNQPEETLRRAIATRIVDGELFQSLNIQDQNGNLVGTTLSEKRSINYADRDYFKQVASAPPGSLIIGVPVLSRLTGEPAVPVARRYDNAEGKFAGLVLVQVRAEAFAGGYKDLDLVGADYVALIGFDGIARAGSIGGLSVHGRDFTESNVLRKQKEAPEGSFSAVAFTDKVFRHVAYRTLEDYPLFVAFGVDAEAARLEFHKRRGEYVSVGALTSLLVLAFGGGLGLSLRQKDRVNAQLRVREEALEALATRDFLTGLPNRVTLEAVTTAKLDIAKVAGTEVACIFIDLDDFGDVNSAMGHPFGDEVLKAVADGIASIGGKQGHLARVGGDEFVLVLDATDDAEAAACGVARLVQEAIERPFLISGTRINLKGSIGISIFPKHALSFAELVRCANEAMAVSKEGRRGLPVLFSPEMDRRAETRMTIRAGLQAAINNNEFDLLYQPKIELGTRRLVGMEALLRWRHPIKGDILPDAFIPIAEESGLIVPIGAWVIRKACLDCATLLENGFPQLAVAVNVSALQFRQPDLASVVAAALDAARVPPSLLELELTESMIANDPEATIAHMERLKRLGVTLAIDDFGTGYSNLQYLRRFPVNVLKIDKSFVSEIDNPSSASIVTAILGVAKALTLNVVAEGVETATQEAFLAKNGCSVAQGFLYSKPMRLSEFQEWARQRR